MWDALAALAMSFLFLLLTLPLLPIFGVALLHATLKGERARVFVL
jgi:hypothetical protein